MNALAIPDPAVKPAISQPRVAVLVDGENLSQDHAGKIILQADKMGRLSVARVYGDATRLSKWATAPRFRLIHTAIGKNSADMQMTIDAMDLALSGQVDTFVLASSDRDFTPLAIYLREKGFAVAGMGEEKTAKTFRAACARFVVLTAAKPEAVVKPAPAPDALSAKLLAVLKCEGQQGEMEISRLSARMSALHQVRISSYPEKTWRAFLVARPSLFSCDPRGPDAKVRLRA